MYSNERVSEEWRNNIWICLNERIRKFSKLIYNLNVYKCWLCVHLSITSISYTHSHTHTASNTTVQMNPDGKIVWQNIHHYIYVYTMHLMWTAPVIFGGVQFGGEPDAIVSVWTLNTICCGLLLCVENVFSNSMFLSLARSHADFSHPVSTTFYSQQWIQMILMICHNIIYTIIIDFIIPYHTILYSIGQQSK